MLTEDEKIGFGDTIDRLVTVPLFFRTLYQKRPVTFELYEAARNKMGSPLTMLAAERLVETVKKGDSVIITTGFIIPNWLQAETDGPIGAASLARAISVGLEATPVFLVEESLVNMMSATCRATGLHTYDLRRAREIPLRATVNSFPIEEEKAKKAAERTISEINPSVIIAVERPSRNEKGVYHPGAGIDISSMISKIDYLFEEAQSREIPTIGIGDHGGEIGFGCIKETAKRVLPLGSKCRCPCGSGIAADTGTDVLVVSAPPSNWGAYGVETCLAALLGYEDILHDSATEHRIIRSCIGAGGIDSTSGLSEPSVDRVPEEINAYMISILHTILRSTIHTGLFEQRHREYWQSKLDTLQERANNWKTMT